MPVVVIPLLSTMIVGILMFVVLGPPLAAVSADSSFNTAISFLTNILGPLIPDIITGFRVSLSMAAILPFAFFIAYGVMSIPAGFAVQRWGEKKLMVASFVAATIGAASFASSSVNRARR